MERVKVSICTGTACFVMGASEIVLLEEELPPELKDMVEVEGVACLDLCKDSQCGKAPFVRINDEVLPQSNLPAVLERIRRLAGG